MTRTRTYVLTAISAALYVILNLVFSTGAFSFEDFWMPGTDVKAPDGTVLGTWHGLFEGTIFVYLFLILIIVAGVYQASKIPPDGIAINVGHDVNTPGQVDDPAFWKVLLGNSYYALLWLPLRFYVGRAWLEAGEHKVFGWGVGKAADGTPILVKGGAGWMDGGMSLKGYWTSAIGAGSPTYSCTPVKDAEGVVQRINDVIQCATVTEIPAKSKVVQDYKWFEDFLRYMLDNGWYDWFAKVIAVGEMLVGIGLIVGALVGIAAFFGSFMNMNFMLAGTTSSNPVLFGLTVFLVLGWKVAGYWGLDRYLLPILGTPWHGGVIVGRHNESGPAPAGD